MQPPPTKVLRYGELDRPALTAAAVRIAERGGIAAVTMRALATELGLSATATYHHISSKRELLDLVAEAVLSDVALPVTGSWQERAMAFALSARRSMLRVRGIAGVLQVHPNEGAARGVDALLEQLVADAGLRPAQREAAKMLVITYVMGSVSIEQAIDGGAHDLTTAHEKRFRQGVRIVIAGIEATRHQGSRG